MMQFVDSLFTEVLAGLIGTILGFLAKTVLDRYQKSKRNKNVIDFFGLDGTKVAIIHSAIYDDIRKAYNFPASDTIAVRKIAYILESIGYREDEDYFIAPDVEFITSDGTLNPQIMDYNLVLTCAPKRNRITKEILERSPKLRYQLNYDEKDDDNLLLDTASQNLLHSSRDIK